MGRRAKNKQGAPPSFEEIQKVKEKRENKKRRSTESKTAEPKKKSKKKPKHDKPVKVVEDEDEFPAGLPEVDYDKLAKEKKSLFEDSEDEEVRVETLDDLPDVGDDEYDSDEAKRAKPIFSDEEDAGDDIEMEKINANNMEKYSKMLDEEAEEEELEAEEELLEGQNEQPRPKILPALDEGEEGEDNAQSHDVTFVRTRMLEIVKVLENFKNLAEEGRSRAEYIDRLIKDICEYYGYTQFLAEKLFNLFTPSEAMEFFEANEVRRPITIRTNTLRTRRRDLAQALVNRGVNLQPIGPWTKVGLQIFDSQVPIGATPEYLAGHYILQAASSFLPVMALDPHPNERILDMAAAPGGKTTYISAMMKGTGVVFANDSNKVRTTSLVANAHRLGCENVIVCNYDAREFPKVIGGFDRVLLDAPCSGTGVISKDQSIKVSRTPKDFMQIPQLQKQLLLSAIDSVNAHSETGGVITYSTCSVTVEEDEAVVDYALRKRPNVKLVETGLAIGKNGFTSYRGKTFHTSLSLTRRYFPHTYNVDGFYVAKFKKIASSPHDVSKAGAKEKEKSVRADEKEEGLIFHDFAKFDDKEDTDIMKESIKRSLKRKGINPKGVNVDRQLKRIEENIKKASEEEEEE
ncbi:rRNA (cytosine-C5-)-methyltransferase nop2 [Brettanomyces nanus]|uniref:Nucleolar protein 2 n=1 Tax=Eeniella nana TaxID=13502 RepID=A0A875S4R7_EENNA|nr:rRNA (cytosine-C5-)-methyltransferase nop2 [Brettanomyces nanus]QPG76631.1 rRNA (cytosine-C5-)-methyltransferase nop2 [Brettanomyces nanus]